MERFFALIERIQQKPEHVRERISLVATIVAFSLVLLFWVSYFPAKLDRMTRTAPDAADSAESPATNLGNLFSSIRQNVRGISDGFKYQVEYAKSHVATSSIDALKGDGMSAPVEPVVVSTDTPSDAGTDTPNNPSTEPSN